MIKILVACPIGLPTEHSLEKWIENVRSFTYTNFEVLVVDGSANEDLYNRWKDKVKIIHINTEGIPRARQIHMCFEMIRKEFLKGDCQRLATIESDVYPPKDVLEKMVMYEGDWISHAFPNGDNQDQLEHGLGCCLFSRRIMEAYGWEDLDGTWTSDGGLWNKVKPDRRFKVMELYNYVTIEHKHNNYVPIEHTEK